MVDNEQSPWGRPPDEQEPPPPKKSMRPFIITIVVVVLFTLGVSWALNGGVPQGQGASLIYDFLLLAMISAGLIGHVMSNPGEALRNVAGWVLIFGILALGYSVWNGGGRLASELNPSTGSATAQAITFRADLSGHYLVSAKVNGIEIDFMIDTGATQVVLNLSDAKKIGFVVDQLSFALPASTANGIVYSAPVRLNSIEVGPIRLENVDGVVNQGELDISLLGMSFLNQLSGYEVRGGLLTLYP